MAAVGLRSWGHAPDVQAVDEAMRHVSWVGVIALVYVAARLQQAHKSLLLKKGYEAIRVKDICDVANVGRSTFYAHYTGKDDLKRSGLEQLRRQLMER